MGSLILPIGVLKLANASTEEVRLTVVSLAPCVVWLASLDASFGDEETRRDVLSLLVLTVPWRLVIKLSRPS